ncbi:hypothetical protein OsJ_00797 [Oryza sativa Japonica Group]|uniref:HMA domain-containing protein n=1 Tax=Oryza sativa subsp. japonica TaxID=39947 RepID=A2ZQF7_ORYSJ|nr:hypothetical protein OsJ_00797 [Oryza sativa Japonica Group]
MGVDDIIAELRVLPAKILLKKKPKQFQKVEVKVRMDCEGCNRKVRKAVEEMKGVSSVEVDAKQNKVTVTGYVEQEEVVGGCGVAPGRRRSPGRKCRKTWCPNPKPPGRTTRRVPPGKSAKGLPTRKPGRLPGPPGKRRSLPPPLGDGNPKSWAVM